MRQHKRHTFDLAPICAARSFHQAGRFFQRYLAIFTLLIGATFTWAQDTSANLRQVSSHPAEDLAPKLSPDGKWLAFVSQRSGNYDIWLRNMETGFVRQLTTHRADDFYPVWDKRQRYIVFVSQRSDAHGDLFRLNLRHVLGELIPKGEPERLTFYMGFDGYPTVSEFDEHIAWVSDRTGRQEIWLQTKRRKEVRQLTHGGATHPAWSPKQGYLAFTSFRDPNNNGDIWLINLYAPNELNIKKTPIDSLERPMWPITKGPAVDGFPTWSPDAKTILFSRHDFDTNDDGRLSPADKSILWSVDVSHLPIDSMRTSTPSFEMFRDTFDARIALSARPVTPAYINAGQPSWSSDSSIYFISSIKGNSDVWSYDAPDFFILPDSLPWFDFINDNYALPHSLNSTQLDSLYAIRAHLTDDQQNQLWDRFTALHQIIDADTVTTFQQAKALYEAGICLTVLGFADRADYYFNYIIQAFPQAREQVAWAELAVHLQNSLMHDSSYDTVVSALIAAIQPLQIKHASELTFLVKTDILLGNLWAAQQKVLLAKNQYKKVEQQFPQFPEYCAQSLFLLADFYEQSDQPDSAFQTFYSVLQKYAGQRTWAMHARNRLLAMSLRQAKTDRERVTRCRQLHQDLQEFGELSFEPLFRAADILSNTGQFQDAFALYDSIIVNGQNAPEQVFRARFRQAELLLRTGEFIDAVAALSKLADDYGASFPQRTNVATDRLVDILLTSAADLKRSENWALALLRYERVLALAPDNIKAHQGYIECLLYLGNIDQAVDAYELQVAQQPNNNILLYSLGLAFSYRGTPKRDGFFTPADVRVDDLERSNDFLRDALSYDYNLIEAYLTLSYNYEMLENHLRWQKERPRSFWHKTGSALAGPLVWFYKTVTFYNETRAPRYYENSIQILTSALSLNDEEANPELEALVALNMANNYYNIGEFGFSKAYEFYHVRMQFDSTFVDSRQEALIMERMGHCAMVVEDAERGPVYLERAIELYRQRNIPNRVLINTKRLALLYEFTQNSQQALVYYQQAADMENQRRLYDGLLRSYRSLAYHHYLLNHQDQAVLYANKGLALLDDGLVERSEGKALRPQFGILGIYFPIPFDLRKIGAKSVLQLSTDEEEAILYSILASTFQNERQFDQAISFYEKKLKIYEQRFDYDAQAIFQNNMAYLYFLQGDYDNAWLWFTNSYWMSVKTKNLGGQLLNITNAAHTVLTIAEEPDEARRTNLAKYHNWISGKVQEMLKATSDNPALYAQNRMHLYILAADLATTTINSESTVDLETSMNASLQSMQHAATANVFLLDALAIAQDKKFIDEECAVYLKRGKLLQMFGEFDEAVGEFEKCRNLAQQYKKYDVLWRANTAIGHILQERLKDGAAKDNLRHEPLYYFQQAISISETHPQRMPGLSAARHRVLVQEPYRAAMRIYIEQNLTDEALALAERMRERQVRDILKADIVFDDRRQDIYVRLDSLHRQIADLESVIQLSNSPQEAVKNRQLLQQIKAELANAMQEMRQDAPELLNFVRLSPVAVSDIQRRLPDSLAILFHMACDDQSFFWVIRKDSVAFQSMPMEKRFALQQLQTRNQLPQEFKIILKSIGENFIIFVPEYDFMMLPWSHVLQPHLNENASLSLCSSLTSVAIALNNNSLEMSTIYVAGKPDRERFRSLPIDMLAPVSQQSGNAASAQRALWAQADIIHLAVNAHWNSMAPATSVLQFDSTQSPATLEPGDLFALGTGRASHLSLNILNEAIPSVDEFIALERSAFFYGISSLIVSSLSAIDSTGLFYQQYYEHLLQNSAHAFRTATESVLLGSHNDSILYMQNFGVMALRGPAAQTGMSNTDDNRRIQADTAFRNRQWDTALTLYAQLEPRNALEAEEINGRLMLCAMNSGQWQKAVSFEQQRIESEKRLNNWQKVATGYQRVAVLNDYLGNRQAAQNARAEHRRLVQEYGFESDMAAPWDELAHILHDGGNDRVAIDFWLRAAEIYQQQRRAADQTKALQRVAEIYAHDLQDISRALETFDHALQTMPESKNAKLHALILVAKARACYTFSLYPLAQHYAEQAFLILNTTEEKSIQHDCAALLAEIHFARGHVRAAIDSLIHILADSSSQATVDMLLLQSRIFIEQDSPEQAVRLARNAVEQAKQLHDDARYRQASLFLASLLWSQGEMEHAVGVLERAIRLQNGRTINRAHLLAAAVLIDANDNERAQQHLQTVRTQLSQNPNALERAMYYYLSSYTADVSQQMVWVEKAVALADSLAQSELLWRAVWRQAQLVQHEHQPESVDHLYRTAATILFNAHPTTEFAQLAYGLAATEDEFFQKYFTHFIRNGKTNSALNVVELQSRRQLANFNFYTQEDVLKDSAVVFRRDSLQQELAYVRAQLLVPGNRNDDALFSDLQYKANALMDNLKQIRQMSSRDLLFADSINDSLNVQQLARSLPKDVLIMRTFYDQEQLYFWLISQNNVSCIQHVYDHIQLNQHILALQQRLNTREPLTPLDHELYDALLLPVADYLESKNRIVVLPYGMLNALPFSVLAPMDGVPLGLDKQILYATTLSTALTSSTAPMRSIGAIHASSSVPELAFTSHVAASLPRYFEDVTIYQADDFIDSTLSLFQMKNNAIYLGLAVTLNSQFPYDAHVQAPFGDGAYVPVFEEWLSQLSAPLLVVHSINNAFMAPIGHESRRDFSTNLLTRKAQQVVLPQWAPDELIGSILLRRFFRHLAEGHTSPEALRLAQKAVFEHIDAHPAAWAAYRLYWDF